MYGEEVVDELAPTDLAVRFPDQQGTDRILAHDGIEKATGLLFRPNERPLNVRQPEAAVLIGVVEERYDLPERVLGCLHAKWNGIGLAAPAK